MIDLTRLRHDPQGVLALLKKKDPTFDGQRLLALDQEVRQVKTEVDNLRSQKNELAKQGQKGITPELRDAAKQLSEKLKVREEYSHTIEKEFKELYLHCPNIILESIPEGNKEQNLVVKTWGEKPVFTFTPKNHVELGALQGASENTGTGNKGLEGGWFDFEAASRMTASNFAVYKGEAVFLVYKLMLFMWLNNIKQGFSPVLPPYFVNEKALEGAGNWPRFKDEVYAISADGLFATPTAEVNLTSMYRDRILMSDQLPIRMTAWTSCFRREAGTYGAAERGLIRIHQFEKVELYTICEPEHAQLEQDRMVASAESILQALGLHYQISLLAAQDTSFSSAKTYDIEVWMPGQGVYKEVSSISNCTDFQARRSEIRYKTNQADKAQLVNTLNGSSLALPRLMVALMETYQTESGEIKLPAVLDSVTLKGL